MIINYLSYIQESSLSFFRLISNVQMDPKVWEGNQKYELYC